MADDITRMAARLMDALTPTIRAHRWDYCAMCDLYDDLTSFFEYYPGELGIHGHRWNGLSWNRDGTISIHCRCEKDFGTWTAFADHIPTAAE
ncbi:hypothetical protein [uncultured Bifidobacterium sp.]|uniref:hypothetical protein n=1 Tax=uncultured Bifidobacterium sp. TaxID=165187 RepID=UPI0027DD343C|nr:hypothetical protein [uncultured Bifidobacterium sp.]